jgi:glycosyltransferase involved in cell wall biosynthesis
MPEVSVIIPNYNHAAFLKQRIQSVLNQTYQDFELIILDDCSSDNSKEIIEGYRNNAKVSTIVFNEQNSGSTFKQWQKGVSVAKGRYIWLAESDDFADERFLEILMKPFHTYDDVIVSYSQSLVVDQHNKPLFVYDWCDVLNPIKWKSDYIESTDNELNSYMKFKCIYPNASALVFKKPEDLDIFNRSISMQLCGDWAFYINLLAAKGRVAFSCRCLNYFRTHENTTRHGVSKKKEQQRFREFKTFVDSSLYNPFEKRYDWMIEVWFDRRQYLKGSLDYFIPSLPFILVLRTAFIGTKMFAGKIIRKVLGGNSKSL